MVVLELMVTLRVGVIESRVVTDRRLVGRDPSRDSRREITPDSLRDRALAAPELRRES